MMVDPIYDPDNDLWLTRKDSLNLLNFQIAFGIISSGIKLLVRQMKTVIRWEMEMVGCHFNSHNAVQLLLSHHRFEEVYLCTVRSSKGQNSNKIRIIEHIFLTRCTFGQIASNLILVGVPFAVVYTKYNFNDD